MVAAGGNEHGELNVSDWTDVVNVQTDSLSTIGLRKGGTVLTVGSNESGELNLSDWTDMLAIYTHYDTTYGLRNDGKVLVAGEQNYSTRALQNQTDVVGLSRSDYCTTVIFSDGTARCFPDDEEYHSSAKLNVSEFRLFDTVDDLVFPMDNAEFKKMGEIAASQREVVDLKQRNKELQAYKELFACNYTHTVGLKADGTVVAAGEQGEYKPGACNVSAWKNMKKVYAIHNMSVGVTQNGNVVYTGYNSNTKGISNWKNVEKLAFGKDLVAALKRDGTACAEGSLYDYSSVSKWTGLVDIACSMYGVYGLKADGTVVYSAVTGIADVKNWTDITAIACGGNHVVGLKSDGTVVAAGSNSEGQCDVSDWKNVMAIYTTTNERDDIYSTKTFALTFDGRLLSTYQYIHSNRNNIVDITAYQSDLVAILADGSITWVSGGRYDVYNPTDWYDIVTVCMGHMSVLGLRRDGSVVYAYNSKYYKDGNCAVDGWEILPGTAESAKQQAEQEAVEEVKSWKRQGRCQHCGGELKGLFTKKCTSCKREKDY